MSIFSKHPEDEVLEYEEAMETPLEEIPEAQEFESIKANDKELVNTYLDEMGIIAEGTTVHGDIRTKGHLAVIGVVEGDVKIAGNLMLTGIIKGDIECNNMVIDSTGAFNTIKARGSVSVKEGCVVNCNITCKHISVLGTVIGNVKATGNVGLSKNSTVRGDITSSVLAVEPGAKIQGMVTVK